MNPPPNKPRTHQTITVMFIVLAFTIIACGPERNAGIDGELCEHHGSGPSQAITAVTSTAASTYPNAAIEHTRVDITLPGGSEPAFVAFEVNEAGEYILALDPALPLEIRDPDETVVIIEKTENGSPDCTEVKVKHTVDLTIGRHTLAFGPSTETEVRLVHEGAGDDAHD